MALRAFHANPSIGGFGDENTGTLLLGDPKETSSASHTNDADPNEGRPTLGGDAFCQIIKELVDNAVDACETAHKEHDKVSYRVRVEISPYNGSDDFLQVTVSDNGCGMEDIQKCVDAFQSSKHSGDDKTAGRYGLGLTLSMVHSQRLVPGRVFCCITSATRHASTFKRQHYFVDTTEDKMRRARDESVPKGAADISGTCVSLLVPGGATASRAWNRIEMYLRRFHLSPTRCSIEVLAPTFAKLPIVVRRLLDCADRNPTLSQDSSESLREGFDSEDESVVSENDRIGMIKVKKAFLQERKALQYAARKYGYFDLPLKLCNIAQAEHIIRHPGPKSSGPDPHSTSPKITVSIIVSPQEETSNMNDGDVAVASMQVVRMVNSVPLLDSVESIACGLVRAIESSVVWSSFGLTVLGNTESTEDAWINRFKVRDGDQVAPFFQQRNHNLWNEKGESNENEMQGSKGKRKSTKLMLPAKVRLGKILLTVNIQALPRIIPLPTLTKGRLPVNHEPINQAFHLGIRDCLRSLQITNPDLLLSSAQLRSVERDVRYIPLVARASANLLGRLQTESHQRRAFDLVEKIRKSDQKGVHGTSMPFVYDEIVRLLEQKSRSTIHEVERARKRLKRAKLDTRADEADQYKDIQDSDNSVHDSATKESILCFEKSLPRPSDDDSLSQSTSPPSPDTARHSQNTRDNDDTAENGIGIREYDDDDEWW